MTANKADLMRKINELSFVLDEVRLFLDTHPDCKEALLYYNEYARLRDQAVAEYQSFYGPLRFYDPTDDCKWQWVTGPWPWEGVC